MLLFLFFSWRQDLHKVDAINFALQMSENMSEGWEIRKCHFCCPLVASHTNIDVQTEWSKFHYSLHLYHYIIVFKTILFVCPFYTVNVSMCWCYRESWFRCCRTADEDSVSLGACGVSGDIEWRNTHWSEWNIHIRKRDPQLCRPPDWISTNWQRGCSAKPSGDTHNYCYLAGRKGLKCFYWSAFSTQSNLISELFWLVKTNVCLSLLS